MNDLSLKERYVGSLIGLAVGDALGTTLEKQRTPKEQLKDIVGGGPFHLLPGQWTDDTSTALLLAESLIESGGFNPKDQCTRYLQWYREGKLSSNGECFDIGIGTRMAVEKFEKSNMEDPYPASTGENARAGNGSLMRLAPIPLTYRKDAAKTVSRAADSSRTTHGSQIAIDACKFYAMLFNDIFAGKSKDEILESSRWQHATELFCPEISNVVSGSYRSKSVADLKPEGYVVESLECALWAFHKFDNFEDGLIAVVNLGGDSDTIGAIYGQLSGLYYGISNIPERWSSKITFKDLIKVFALSLLKLSESEPDTESSEKFQPGSDYIVVQQCYRILEDGYKPILRKLNPGPRQYKSLEEYDQDVAEFKNRYQETAPNDCTCKESLLNDFLERLLHNRSNLEKKLVRGRALPFVLPTKP